MTHLIRRFAPALATLAALCAAPAQASLLSNASFETAVPALTGAAYCYGCANGGWSGTAVVIKSNSSAWGTPQSLGGYAFGSQLVGLQNNTYVEQSLSLAAGTYLLSWSDAGRSGYQSTMYNVLFDGNVLGTSLLTRPGQAWSGHSLSFTASGNGVLRFQGLAINNDGTAFIDNLALTRSSVPEPASIALVLLALAGAAGASRRPRAAVNAAG